MLIASPRSASDWIRITTRVLTRQRRTDPALDRITGRRVRITVEERDQYQLDGDTVGECNTMTAEVVPGALTLRVPQATRRTPLPSAEEAKGTGGAVSQGLRSRSSHADASA